jgi:hypothetical protein
VFTKAVITPVNLCTFSLGTFLDLGVLLVNPRLNRFGTLLVSLLDRLLRGESPACKVVAHRANGERKAITPFNELFDRRTRPQGKIHLELFGTAITDRALNLPLLLCTQVAPRAHLLATYLWLERCRAAGAV